VTSKQLQAVRNGLLNQERAEELPGAVIVEKKLPGQQWPKK
jgi:hypothetical protein